MHYRERLDQHLDADQPIQQVLAILPSVALSTKTTLKVQSDICEALDNSGTAVLIFLELSLAFDTIDHGLLLKLLENSFGVAGDARMKLSTARNPCPLKECHPNQLP